MNDIVIDTNALVLFVLGTVNEGYIGKHKCLSIYSLEDYSYLINLISRSCRIITSPNVLTEVDNLCNRLKGDDKYRYIKIFREISNSYQEKYRETKKIVKDELMWDIGLTDVVLIDIAKKSDLLITADSSLSDKARAEGIKVIDLKQRVTSKYIQEMQKETFNKVVSVN